MDREKTPVWRPRQVVSLLAWLLAQEEGRKVGMVYAPPPEAGVCLAKPLAWRKGCGASIALDQDELGDRVFSRGDTRGVSLVLVLRNAETREELRAPLSTCFERQGISDAMFVFMTVPVAGMEGYFRWHPERAQKLLTAMMRIEIACEDDILDSLNEKGMGRGDPQEDVEEEVSWLRMSIGVGGVVLFEEPGVGCPYLAGVEMSQWCFQDMLPYLTINLGDLP